jgi:hypothetical protein
VRELERELTRVGIPRSRRRRILAELEDHLACDPAADLGEPAALARQFADELGTVRARRAGFAAFGALAIAGLLFATAFIDSQRHADASTPGVVGLVLAVLGAQVAFVAGGLGVVRALRNRRELVVARAEALVLARRAGTGLLAGLTTMGGMALLARSNTFALIACGVGAFVLLVAAPSVIAAARLVPVAPGDVADMFDDPGPLIPRLRPWRFALLVALAVAVAIATVGVAQQDPYDGALRGLLDGLACLGGFAVFGRYLGLRSS